jgi:protein-S-isoprenylcysteine O-methyltransferase Ste14
MAKVSFDPFGWITRWVAPQTAHRAIRIGAITVFAYFLTRRVAQYDDFLLKPLWIVETLIYVVLAAAFFVRIDPIDRSRGVREVLVPLAGGVLPFALLTTSPHPAIWKNPTALYTVFWCMTLATALTIWGMWTSRRAFSITVEARELVTSGPYRWIRHPIYAGEILTGAAVTVWRWSWLNAGLFVLFAAIQLARARWEEQKLARVFPEYAAIARTRVWLW